ncbi:MAG: hypothetical protein ACHQM4_01030 [Thermoanaerobaculia bacterium]
MAKSGIELESELDGLYALPLPGFVGARNALAKKLEASGRKEDAARVKALKKPTPAAWAVNQLAFSAPRLLRALVAYGDRLRANPSDVRSSMQERREALNEGRKAAEKALTEAGHSANADVLRRASATLEAIATYGSVAGRPVAGRHSEDVPAPGFDEVASLGLLGGSAAARRSGAGPARPAAKPVRRATSSPEKPSKRDAARERAFGEMRRREAKKALAARAKQAQLARASLRAAEKAVEASRRRKASAQAALSEAAAEERRLEAELVEARKATQVADIAERDARIREREKEVLP